MATGVGAGAVLLSPLAVEDVFCQQSVPEVQELLRQLQLQQANDAEEVRNLIGIRYLSFLDGFPEISTMQRTAEEALQEAKKFGSCLKRLGVAVAGEVASASSDNVDRPRELQHEQLHEELLLQRSTPLDDLLLARVTDSSASALGSSFEGKASPTGDACVGSLSDATSLSSQSGHSGPQTFNLRFLQQQLLLLPSRVWEALRGRRFLEALRLVLVEGSHQTVAVTAAVQRLQRQKQPTTRDLTHAGQEQQHWKHQFGGCLALAQQTTAATPSLVASVRTLALRHLASADLSLPLAADAAAAATLIFLLEGRQFQLDASEQDQDELAAAAASWLLTVFFSARGEAIEAQGALVGSAVNEALSEDAAASPAGGRGAAAVDAAEGLLVAFTSSADAAAFLFWPLSSDTAAGEASAAPAEGLASSAASSSSAFAAVGAAEAALGPLSAPALAGVARALQALRKVFCGFETHLCSSASSGASGSLGSPCCNNNDLCPRAKLAAFTEQWKSPLEALLRRLPHEGPWRKLNDFRSFWIALRERLQARSRQWRLSLDASLFAAGRLETDSKPGRPGAFCGDQDRAHLLRVVGEACVEACTAMCVARVRELPLFDQQMRDGEPFEPPAGYEGREQHCKSAFEKDLSCLLSDLADLMGASEKAESQRVSLPVCAKIAAAFFRALGESANSLRAFACVAGSVGSSESHGDHSLCCDQETCASLIWKARRVEWLFVACSAWAACEAFVVHAASSVQHEPGLRLQTRTNMCGSRRCKPVLGDPAQLENREEPFNCQRKLGDFFSQWTAGIAERKDSEEAFVESEGRLSPSGDEFQEIRCERETKADILCTVKAAAQSFLSDVCISSLLGYAVGCWPFVKKATKELQPSWRWRRTVLDRVSHQSRVSLNVEDAHLHYCFCQTRGNHRGIFFSGYQQVGFADGASARLVAFTANSVGLEISGGAMSLLLEVCRYLTATMQDLRLEDLRAAPLLCYALKSVTAEAAAMVASAAIAETADRRQEAKGDLAAHLSENSLLQLVVDIELLAEALGGMPLTFHSQNLPDEAHALPMSVRRAVKAALNNHCSAEALRDVAREGSQRLSTTHKEALRRSLAGGLSLSSSLFLALGDLRSPCASRTPSPSADGGFKRSTAPPILAAPRERLPLLPIRPLPTFASLVSPLGSEPHEVLGSQEVTHNGAAQGEKQQQPKERLKQLPRLRLDDAVDSVSRGLQSWLKRGSSETEGAGMSFRKTEGPAFSGAGKGASAVSAAGSGLAEAWAKQIGQVGALLGQSVESVQSLASQSSAPRRDRRTSNESTSNLPASPASADQQRS
ncbi:hypothetical protein Emag_000591 [Eimeria magna]